MEPCSEAQMRENGSLDKQERWIELGGLGHVFKMKWTELSMNWLWGLVRKRGIKNDSQHFG